MPGWTVLTRMPAVLPQRITPSLVRTLARFQPLFLNVHPVELQERWLVRPDDPLYPVYVQFARFRAAQFSKELSVKVSHGCIKIAELAGFIQPLRNGSNGVVDTIALAWEVGD